MLHAGLDLSRKKVDVCLLSEEGEHLDQLAVPPDVDSLRTLARRIDEVHGEPVCAVVESMTGARLVHDTLEQQGWSVEIADAQKVKGLAPLACKTDKIDSKVLAVLSHRDLVPAIWLPDPQVREERELARFRLHLVKHKSALKCRIQERYQRNNRRLGKQRGAKVAQIDIARRLAHAIWHMLTRNEEFAPRGAAFRLAA
jgi:transposase